MPVNQPMRPDTDNVAKPTTEKELLRPFRAGVFQRMSSVISKRLKRRFNLIQRFALEVILHGRQILGYAVSIHRAFSSLAV